MHRGSVFAGRAFGHEPVEPQLRCETSGQAAVLRGLSYYSSFVWGDAVEAGSIRSCSSGVRGAGECVGYRFTVDMHD